MVWVFGYLFAAGEGDGMRAVVLVLVVWFRMGVRMARATGSRLATGSTMGLTMGLGISHVADG